MTAKTETPRRFTHWCLASHGHDLIEEADGKLMLYEEHERMVAALRERLERAERSLLAIESLIDDFDAALAGGER